MDWILPGWQSYGRMEVGMARGILKNGIPALAVIIALGIVGFGIYTEFTPKNLPLQPKTTAYPTYGLTPTLENAPPYTVQRGDVTREITLTGQISSPTKQELFFRTRGPVDKILVKKNEKVTSGQLLANLYLSQIQFELKRAQINLDIGRLNLAMAQQQPKSGYLSPTPNPITLALAQKQIDLAELNVQNINATIADMQIFSPVDATVTAIFLKEGSQANDFEPVIEIADLARLDVVVNPIADDVNQLALNLPVSMHTSRNPAKVLNGAITSLPAAAAGSSSIQSEDDLVHISVKEDPLSAGYQYGDQVQASIVVERKSNVLWLPPEAISTNGGHSYVTIKDDQGQRQVEVKVGLKTDSQVEILSGVKEGQGVYIPY